MRSCSIAIQRASARLFTLFIALNNARNVQAGLGKENLLIEIVAYGPGPGMLKRERPYR